MLLRLADVLTGQRRGRGRHGMWSRSRLHHRLVGGSVISDARNRKHLFGCAWGRFAGVCVRDAYPSTGAPIKIKFGACAGVCGRVTALRSAMLSRARLYFAIRSLILRSMSASFDWSSSVGDAGLSRSGLTNFLAGALASPRTCGCVWELGE